MLKSRRIPENTICPMSLRSVDFFSFFANSSSRDYQLFPSRLFFDQLTAQALLIARGLQPQQINPLG